MLLFSRSGYNSTLRKAAPNRAPALMGRRSGRRPSEMNLGAASRSRSWICAYNAQLSVASANPQRPSPRRATPEEFRVAQPQVRPARAGHRQDQRQAGRRHQGHQAPREGRDAREARLRRSLPQPSCSTAMRSGPKSNEPGRGHHSQNIYIRRQLLKDSTGIEHARAAWQVELDNHAPSIGR